MNLSLKRSMAKSECNCVLLRKTFKRKHGRDVCCRPYDMLSFRTSMRTYMLYRQHGFSIFVKSKSPGTAAEKGKIDFFWSFLPLHVQRDDRLVGGGALRPLFFAGSPAGAMIDTNNRTAGININHAMRRAQFRFARSFKEGRFKVGLNPVVTYGLLRKRRINFSTLVPPYRPLLSESGLPRWTLITWWLRYTTAVD